MAYTISITILDGDTPTEGFQKGQLVSLTTPENPWVHTLATVNCLINKPCILCGEPVIMPEEGQSWCNPCKKSPERRQGFYDQAKRNDPAFCLQCQDYCEAPCQPVSYGRGRRG